MAGADDFHQLHHLHWVEEVQSDESIGSSRSYGHVADGQGGRVRGEDALAVDERAQRLVEVYLHVFLFDNGLHGVVGQYSAAQSRKDANTLDGASVDTSMIRSQSLASARVVV